MKLQLISAPLSFLLSNPSFGIFPLILVGGTSAAFALAIMAIYGAWSLIFPSEYAMSSMVFFTLILIVLIIALWVAIVFIKAFLEAAFVSAVVSRIKGERFFLHEGFGKAASAWKNILIWSSLLEAGARRHPMTDPKEQYLPWKYIPLRHVEPRAYVPHRMLFTVPLLALEQKTCKEAQARSNLFEKYSHQIQQRFLLLFSSFVLFTIVFGTLITISLQTQLTNAQSVLLLLGIFAGGITTSYILLFCIEAVLKAVLYIYKTKGTLAKNPDSGLSLLVQTITEGE